MLADTRTLRNLRNRLAPLGDLRHRDPRDLVACGNAEHEPFPAFRKPLLLPAGFQTRFRCAAQSGAFMMLRRRMSFHWPYLK